MEKAEVKGSRIDLEVHRADVAVPGLKRRAQSVGVGCMITPGLERTDPSRM